MKLATIKDKLCCPFDKSDLGLKIITQDEEDRILEGVLDCPVCRRVYPIISGIPIMTPDEFREPALEAPLLERWEKELNGGRVINFRLAEPAGKRGDNPEDDLSTAK